MNLVQTALQSTPTALRQTVCGGRGTRQAALCGLATLAAYGSVEDAGTPPLAAHEAVLIARQAQAAADLPPDTPFLVQGPDPRLNAAAAESLADGGATRVWVVAQ